MLTGAFALLERSLRVDARAWSPHLARLGLMVAIYFSLCYASITSFMFGAPGLRFFQGIAYLDATFMTLLGIGFFSTSITEEKEEDTLGLMMMAGISPLGILAGKSGGRLWQSLLLIVVQYPFVLLAVTMGGVMGTQVWSVTIALLSYMIFLAGFGLLCSTIAPRSQLAAAAMIVGLLFYIFVPMIANEMSSSRARSILNVPETPTSIVWALIGSVGEISVFVRLGNILTTGFGESVWSIQVISNALAGMTCAGISWLVFGIATRSPSTESASRGLVTRYRGFSPFSAGRAWFNPFIWKDFHFTSGGTGMFLIRMLYYSTLGIAALVLEQMSGYPMAMEWYGFCLFLMWLSVTIDAARVLSCSMQDEVRGKTLASLMILPRSTNRIVYSKFAGAMIGWLPGPTISLAVAFISPDARKNLLDMMSAQNGRGMVVLMMVLYFALVPHFAAFVSLYVRWGAVALAIGMTIGVYFGLGMSIMLCLLLFSGSPGAISSRLTQDLLFGGISLVLFCLNAACHIGVLLRVQALGAK